MKTIWYIAKKDLLQTLKDRNSFFLLLAVPLFLIAVVGLAFGNIFGGGTSQITITVAVSNQDNGSVGAAIVSALRINTDQLKITSNQYTDTQQVTDQVANTNNVNAGIVIPAGTTDKVLAAAQNGTLPKNLFSSTLCRVIMTRVLPSCKIS